MTDDAELLRQYADQRSQAAFAAFVGRHLDFIYAAALRQLHGDAHRAAEVSQYVFTQAARQARPLARHCAIKGWLYTTARNASANVVRSEVRRAAREAEARAMNESESPGLAAAELQPAIEHGFAALNEREREAVFLRFFEDQDYAAIGGRYAISADAARLRVERALEKMKRSLERRGVFSTTAALAGALSAQAAVCAPGSLAATITGAAMAASATGSVSAPILTFMTMTKTHVGLASALLLVGGLGLFLRQQHRGQPTAAATAMAHPVAPPARLPTAAAPARPRPPAAGVVISNSSQFSGNSPVLLAGDWTNRGRQSPTDALESFFWATRAFDLATLGKLIGFSDADRATAEALFAQIPPEARAKLQISSPEEMFGLAWALDNQQKAGALQIGAISRSGPDTTIDYSVQRSDHNNRIDPGEMTFQHVDDDGWQWLVPEREATHTFGDIQKKLLKDVLGQK